MSTPPPPPDPRRLLQEAGLGAKKSWGQNFLRDPAVLQAIADAAQPGAQQPVLEIGAGLGALTHHLLLAGGEVVAVERDRDIAPLLREALLWAGDRLQVIEADAAGLDYAAWAERLGGPVRVAGNLPYQISSRILVSLADQAAALHRAVVMVQREVADRVVAPPGSRTFGLLSVLVQRSLQARVLRRVSPGSFMPAPKVHSTVLVLEPRAERREPLADARLVAAARAGFSQRRKTLRNALSRGLHAAPETVELAIRAAGLDPGARAETLSVASFAGLGEALARHGLL